MGTPVDLHVDVENVVARTSGFIWSLRAGPLNSNARLESNGDANARFTPDTPGAFLIGVLTPYGVGDAGALSCPVYVDVDPVDPACPGDPISLPRVLTTPGGAVQFAFDAAFGGVRASRSNVMVDGGTELREVFAADDPETNVAAALMDVPANTDLEVFARSVESSVQSILGATPVLVGRGGMTADGLAFRRSVFRVTTAVDTTAAVARDRVARDLVMLNPGAARAGFGSYRSFTIETNVIARPSERRATILLAVAPESLAGNAATRTPIRLSDFTNASALALPSRRLDLVCRAVATTRTITADFLWLVDTSSSMSDDQERVGNTAEQFFREMSSAGIDFRVGVIQAGSQPPADLDSPGFEWISGAATDGPRRLAHAVTYRRYRDDPADQSSPYPLTGGSEEPAAAGVIVGEEMERRATTDRDDRRRFRARAVRVAFLATDEVGTNDDDRYFARNTMRWGATPEARIVSAANWYRDHGFLTFALVDVFGSARCPTVDNFIPCLVVRNGGAYIPIRTAMDVELAAAMSRIVDAVAAAGSEFTLPQTPISSTIRVRLDDRTVPRSRSNGFDLDENGRTLIFRGSTYRPRPGQQVRGAYFTWR